MFDLTRPFQPGVRFASAGRCLALVLMVFALLALNAGAATRTWSGIVSGNWSFAANWAGGVVPGNGDSLVFPASVSRVATTNDLALQLSSISFSGSNYVLNGNAIALSGGITLNNFRGTNTIQFSIDNLTGQTFSCVNTSAVLVINGDLVQEVSALVADGAGTNIFNGVISGNGGVTKNGSGVLRYGGVAANTYAGTTTVNSGLLQLAKSGGAAAIAGALVVGDDVNAATVRYLAANLVGNISAITVNQSSKLDLNGFDDIVGPLAIHGGAVTTGAGTLNVRGGITSLADTNLVSSLISGKLSLGGTTLTIDVARGCSNLNLCLSDDLVISAVISDGGAGAGITKTGPGILRLSGANTYSGLTTVNGGTTIVGNANALGASGTTTNGTQLTAGTVRVDGVAVGNEVLMFSTTSSRLEGIGTASWAGPVMIGNGGTVDTDGTLTLSGVISSLGTGVNRLQKNGTGTLVFSGGSPNTYTNDTLVSGGTLLLAKSQTAQSGAIHGRLTINSNCVVRLQATSQLADNATVILKLGGVFDLNGIPEYFGGLLDGAVDQGGSVTLGTPGVFFPMLGPGLNDADSKFSGVISGTGGVIKLGSGTITFAGDNTYTGATTNLEGTLVINGSQPQSPVNLEGGGLAGSGTIGTLTAGNDGGVVTPGTVSNSLPGILTCSNVSFNAATTFRLNLNGNTPGTGYGQLNVHGSVNLGGAVFTNSVGAGFSPVQGQAIVIVNKDGTNAVTGTFAGLTNGSTVPVGNLKMRIDYKGGTGNDVTLTLTNLPLLTVQANVVTGNGLAAIGNNQCNLFYLTVSNTTGTNLPASIGTLSTTTPHVIVSQAKSTYPAMAIGGKATNAIPFVVSVLPSFDCGSDIDLILNVTSSYGQLGLKIRTVVGSIGTPVEFASTNAPAAIPDVGTLISTVSVPTNALASNFILQDIAVSMYMAHPADVDVTNISLVGPDGTTVLLSGNIGIGTNYGVGCDAGSRTYFSGLASTSITNGTPPYLGTFQPLQSLSAFLGKTGTNVTGNWKLRISDGFTNGSQGTLSCWSLFLAPRACLDGGGYCSASPGVFSGTLAPGDATNSVRLLASGSPSTCAVTRDCPGTTNTGALYDIYYFTNHGAAACVTVTLDSGCPVSVAAYKGDFTPDDPCPNYLADLGGDAASGSFSFPVDAQTIFVIDGDTPPVITSPVVAVVVSRPLADAGSACDYSLQVSGLGPQLGINQATSNSVKLFWPASVSDYRLESAPKLVLTNASSSIVARLSTNNWTVVTNPPRLEGGNLVVTNTVTTNRFYRLHLP